MKILGKNYPNNALVMGGIIGLVLAVLPYTSGIISSLVGTVRGFISSALTSK